SSSSLSSPVAPAEVLASNMAALIALRLRNAFSSFASMAVLSSAIIFCSSVIGNILRILLLLQLLFPEFLHEINGKFFHVFRHFSIMCCPVESISHGHQGLIKEICHFINHHLFCPQVHSQCGFISTIPKRNHHGFCLSRLCSCTICSVPRNFFRNSFII